MDDEMLKKAVFPGQYLQGQGALKALPGLIARFGSRGLILGSKSVKDKILPAFGGEEILRQIPVELFRGECSEEELTRVGKLVRDQRIDILIGMGGGKTIDTAKIVADRADIQVIIVPTIASTDAPCSGCAVIYSPGGEFESVSYQKRNPTAVVVDMDIIAQAPVRFLVSGMGDALATWFEARSCHHTRSANECGGLSTLSGLNLARLCYDTILEYGVPAKQDCENNTVTPALEFIAEANILLSGLGFESSGLAAAHAIHNGLTALTETHSFYHGEKVAFGVLSGLHLTQAPEEEIDTVYSFCERIGLPTTLADIGIKKPDQEYLMIAARKACEPGQSVHHEEGTITPEKVLAAMIKADAVGRTHQDIYAGKSLHSS